MIKSHLLQILKDFQNKNITMDDCQNKVMDLMRGKLDFAELDLSRSLRTGFPEVVYCTNKSESDILKIAKMLYQNDKQVLLTRARQTTFDLLHENFEEIEFHQKSGVIIIGKYIEEIGNVSVVCAGTSDIPIAEEALLTAKVFGAKVNYHWDIGIAGIHRLFSKMDELRKSNVIIAVAGMDGALPGVIAGLTEAPVIAVPTSVGYGTGTGGYAALMTMLNSCAPGVSVVNIDNGFGAGYIAAMINKKGVSQK